MSWYDFIDIGTPLVFSPKVSPDPIDAERLNEKFQQAMRILRLGPPYVQQPASAPSFTTASISRIG